MLLSGLEVMLIFQILNGQIVPLQDIATHSLDLNNSFIDFLDNNALSQTVEFPTWASNTLDIFVTD